ncbi:MAG TPA: SpoIIE family protein phosphatase [Polyangiaceae bacterium]|nr:SpoIIE family protein phosphatase [Polyangiaceae bacterium]
MRAFLFVALGATGAVPVALLGAYQARWFAERDRQTTDRAALAAATAAAEELRAAMLSHVHAAETLSAQLAVLGNLDEESVRPVLKAHIQTQPDFLGAYVANRAGVSLVHVRPSGEFSPGGVSYADRDYYRTILRTHHAAISGAAVGRVTHVLTVQVAAPITSPGGELEGLSCSSLNLGTLTAQAVQNGQGLVDGRMVFVDGEGRRIADSAAPAEVEPKDVSRYAIFAAPGSATGALRTGLDERGRLVRVAAVGLGAPVADWRVFVLTPEASIAAHARRAQLESLVVALGSLLAALGLAAWLAGRIGRPLRALAASSDAVTRGTYGNLPALPAGAPRELEQLSSALALMVDTLRKHAQGLEAEVAERTQALRETNAELTRALERIVLNERAIRKDIENARLFQAKLLPRLPAGGRFDVAVHYGALERVSGDIYDIAPLAGPNPGLRVFLADVTGHGVQASLRTMVLKAAYDRLKAVHGDPRSLLEALNDYLVGEFPDGELHATAVCLELVLGPGGATLRFVNAGSAPLYVFSPAGGARELYAAGPLLGADHVEFPEPERAELAPGELLLVASDGLIEQANAAGARYELELSELRLALPGSAEASLARILHAFDAFRGDEKQVDDVTLVAIVPG